MRKILIFLNTLLLMAFIVLLFMGSMESVPSPEQQEKAKIGYGFICIVLAILELLLIQKQKKQ